MKHIGSKQISEAGPQTEHLEQTVISFYLLTVLCREGWAPYMYLRLQMNMYFDLHLLSIEFRFCFLKTMNTFYTVTVMICSCFRSLTSRHVISKMSKCLVLFVFVLLYIGVVCIVSSVNPINVNRTMLVNLIHISK